MGRAATDKRARLVQSAVKLFHHDGLQATSIANIARDAGVPLGNVYYYFPTKDAIVRAVVDHWIERIDFALEGLVPDGPPQLRLAAFLDLAIERANVYASVGCPLVALARDLRLSGGTLAPLAEHLVARQTNWIGRMLQSTGVSPADPAAEAKTILATLQGSFQLAFALGEPDVVRTSAGQLKRQLQMQRH